MLGRKSRETYSRKYSNPVPHSNTSTYVDFRQSGEFLNSNNNNDDNNKNKDKNSDNNDGGGYDDEDDKIKLKQETT